MDLQRGHDLAQKLLQKFAPEELKFLRIDGEELLFAGYSISPSEMEVKSIIGKRYIPAWEVIEWTHVPATREDPDDVIDSQVGKYSTIQQAVQEVVVAILERYVYYCAETLLITESDFF